MACEVRVSVVIPVFNGARYIKQAIDSALIQDVPLEVIVIDDCSTDDLHDVLSAYEDESRLRVYRNDTGLGVAKSRNRGVSLAQAEYVAFLDADDYWTEGKLKSQLEEMERTGAVISSTARELIRPDGTPVGRIIGIPERIEYRDILRTNPLSCSAVVARKDVLLEFPMEHDDSHEDYITWIRIIDKYGFAIGIDKPYLKYRLSEGGKSRNKFKSAKMQYKAYRYCGIGVCKSLIFFISYAINGFKKYYC